MTNEEMRGVPREEPCAVKEQRASVSIGIPRCSVAGERRLPITPEGAQLLVDRGLRVKIEAGAGETIHYSDARYARAGAEIVGRTEALGCDAVIHLAPLEAHDARHLRRGALLLTLLHLQRQTPQTLFHLLGRRVTAMALDLVADAGGNAPFADILAEIDGRAAVSAGAALLADPRRGKGILLGGVSGVIPCEVVVIGSGIAGRAAARSAAGMGALVRMFDNDVYRLRRTARELTDGAVVTSALHPRVFQHALHSADMLVVTPTEVPVALGRESLSLMKRGAVLFDLASPTGASFPGLPAVDVSEDHGSLLDHAFDGTAGRVALVNPGGSVGRTAAMAMSNTLVTTFDKLLAPRGGLNAALRQNPGLRRAVYTYLGHIVNPAVAAMNGQRQIDINIYLSLS